MKEVKRIETISLTRLDKAAHVASQVRLYNKVNEFDDKTVINVDDDDLSDWKNYITKEQDMNREAKALFSTQSMNSINTGRNSYISYLFNHITNSCRLPDETISEPAVKLDLATRPYRKIQSERNDAKTQLINGLLVDLRKEENAALVTALNLDSVVTALDEANQRYAELLQERSDTKVASKRKLNTSLRVYTDNIYTYIVAKIEASWLLCKDAEAKKKIELLMDEMSGIIDETRTSYNMSHGITRPDEGDRPVIPEEPEEPEEPVTPPEEEEDRPPIE